MICCFHFAGSTKDIDHLASLASLLQIPLYVTDRELSYRLKDQYPHLTCEYLNELEAPSIILERHSALISSLPKEIVSKMFLLEESKRQKKLLTIWFPENVPSTRQTHEFLSLATGEMGYELHKKLGVENVLMIGNIKYQYFKKHRSHYNKVTKKTALISPDWEIEINYRDLIHQLSKEYHPMIPINSLDLERYQEAERLFAEFEEYFFLDFYPSYPLLDPATIFVGGMDHYAYDFLIYDRPITLLGKGSLPIARKVFSEEISVKQLQKLLQTFLNQFEARWHI